MRPCALQRIDVPAPGGERSGLGLTVTDRGLQVGPQEIEARARAGAQEYSRRSGGLIEPCQAVRQINFVEHQGDGNAGRQLAKIRRPRFRIVAASVGSGADIQDIQHAIGLRHFISCAPDALDLDHIDGGAQARGIDEVQR